MDSLDRLAGLYGVDPTLDAVADAIIGRTDISHGINERAPVMAVVALLVRDPGTLDLMEAGDKLPLALRDEMTSTTDVHKPAMPSDLLVSLVLTDVNSILRQPSGDAA
jgi:hypothetical protein